MKKKIFIALFLGLPAVLKVTAQNNTAPSARSGYAMAYDVSRGTVVLFGGQDTASTRLHDTWEWHDGVWSPVNIAGPSARINAAMAYDADKKIICLFGGRAEEGIENDLWTYNGKAWTKVKTAVAPPPRQLGTMAYSKSTSQFVMFGGMASGKKVFGDTWILKDGQWTEAGSKGPTNRASACMTNNDDADGIFLYGGYVNDDGSKEFWQFKNDVWTNVDSQTGPPRIHASISYDSDKKRFLLFGGFGNNGRTNELWEFTNNKWSQIAAGAGTIPETRAEHRSVYIPGKGLFVFGGVIGTDPNTRNRGNDTWLYYGGAWTKL